MKINNALFEIILLSFILLLILNPTTIEGRSKRNEGDSDGPSRQSELFCNKLGLNFQINLLYDDRNEEYYSCKEMIKRYLSIYIEQDDAISKLAKFCKRKYIRGDDCAEFVVVMNNYGWDMDNLLDLLENISVYRYINGGPLHRKLMITYKDWNAAQKIPGFQLGKCVDNFMSEFTIKERMIWIGEYKDWLDKQQQESGCSCVEVFGIYKLYRANYKRVPLSEYLDKFCMGDNKIQQVWSKPQYEAIARSATLLDVPGLFNFLKLAEPIAKSGWWDGMEVRQWIFRYIVHVCKLNSENDASVTTDYRKECINLVALAIEAKVSSEKFERFLLITDDVNDDFKEMRCKNEIMKVIFKPKAHSYTREVFDERLEAILEVFKMDKITAHDCETFTSAIKDVNYFFHSSTNEELKHYLDFFRDAIIDGNSLKKTITNMVTLFLR